MHTFTRPYYQQSNNNNNKIGQTDCSYEVGGFLYGSSDNGAIPPKTAAKIKQSFKTTKLFAFFFHSTLRFLRKLPNLHDFCAKICAFSPKVVIFATSKQTPRQIDKRRLKIPNSNTNKQIKEIRLW